MSRHGFLFGLFCVAVVGLFGWATADGYSPFADGGGRIFVHGPYGPTHK